LFNYNRVTVTGYLGKDPETAPAGATTVTKFSIAVTDRWKDSAGERQERTNWLNVVVWNGNGENASQFLHKGSHVLIEGSLRTSEWEDKASGQKRWAVEIHASQVIFLDKKPEDTQQRLPAATSTRKKKAP
jgi:single-strand DNA-binding protein